jgi:hypothetical protein
MMPDDTKLEEFIHAQLQQLPQCEAPASLIENVFAAVARKETLPWYKQAFTEWPRLNQIALLSLLIAFAGFLVWAAIPATQQVSVDALTERVGAMAWVGNVAGSMWNAFLLVGKTVPWQWAIATGLGIAGMAYLTCVAGGMALYRVAVSSKSSV